MSIQSLLEPISGQPGNVRLSGAEDWMQGRTLYGGASALIAYTMAKRAFPDLAPLRSAQIGFVAPVGEEIELTASVIRKGRNVTQVRSEIACGDQIALTALWLFAEDRPANGIRSASRPSDWSGDPLDQPAVSGDRGPAFLGRNFEVRYGQDKEAERSAMVRRWVRLRQGDDLDPTSRLVLMGDVNPPGAMRIMERPGPISSINWSFNLLAAENESEDGWYLAENASQHADKGYSSERLRMWDRNGQQVLDGLQSVAIFG